MEASIKLFYHEDDIFAKKIKGELKKKLIRKKLLTAEETDKLCQLQEKLIELLTRLKNTEINIKETEERINIINYNISVQQGHVFLNNQIGNEADFTYNSTSLESISEVNDVRNLLDTAKLMQNFNLADKTSELNTQLIEAKELVKEITMEKKYHDLKRALQLVLEKSDDEEEIIATNQLVISDEMKETLAKIKQLKHKSQEKDSIYQKLTKKRLTKEQELKELKQVIIANNQLEEDELEDILEAQAEFIKDNTSKRLERIKKKLAKTINKAEIDQLCQLQTAITQLELELNQNIDQSTKQLTHIINNISSINIQQGNAFVDSQTFGDNINLNTDNYQAQIFQSPKFN